MQMTTQDANQELVEHWRVGEVLHVNGIAFPSGIVTLLRAFVMTSGPTLRCHAEPFADTSIDSLLHYDASIWVPVTTLASLPWSPTTTVVCGEGPMGNEGFVAATDSRENRPLWTLFSTASNPFTSLSREGDYIIAEAGYEQAWRIPLADPVRFSIVDI